MVVLSFDNKIRYQLTNTTKEYHMTIGFSLLGYDQNLAC